MNIQIKATNLELTESIESYIEKRLQSVVKFLEQDSTAQCMVEVARTTNHHKHGDIFRAEIRISSALHSVYVESEKEDLYAAIDAARNEASGKLSSGKDKRVSVLRRGGARVKNMIKGIWGQE